MNMSEIISLSVNKVFIFLFIGFILLMVLSLVSWYKSRLLERKIAILNQLFNDLNNHLGHISVQYDVYEHNKKRIENLESALENMRVVLESKDNK